METFSSNWRNKVWLGWFVLQLFAIGFFDAVPFYPTWLYQAPGAPLHVLQQLRDFYIAEYNDPIVQEDKQPHYMGILFFIEIAMQLPIALYSVYCFGLGSGKRAGTTGRFELALLVYALETTLSTVLCLHFVYALDPVEYPKKNILLLQNYGPWFIAPACMFVDMFYRLYTRLSTTDIVKKDQ